MAPIQSPTTNEKVSDFGYCLLYNRYRQKRSMTVLESQARSVTTFLEKGSEIDECSEEEGQVKKGSAPI